MMFTATLQAFPEALILKKQDFKTGSKSILIIAPHPDDDAIGCGGSIAQHIQAGNFVATAYMTSGQQRAQEREQEAVEASKIMGTHTLYFLRNTDGALTCDTTTIQQMVDLIILIKPDIVYAPHKRDGHRDHQTTYTIVESALARLTTIHPLVLLYEVWTPFDRPTLCNDITTVMHIKMHAIQRHKSQCAMIRFDLAAQGLNQYRAMLSRCGQYAEAFCTMDYSNGWVEKPMN